MGQTDTTPGLHLRFDQIGAHVVANLHFINAVGEEEEDSPRTMGSIHLKLLEDDPTLYDRWRNFMLGVMKDSLTKASGDEDIQFEDVTPTPNRMAML